MSVSRSIILLSGTRCGSTAIYNMFRKHPDVKIPHVNQNVGMCGVNIWESHFWSFVTRPHKIKRFRKRYKECCPFLDIPKDIEGIDSETVYAMWDEIVDYFGPVVFDKSPGYMGNDAALELIMGYKSLGNDVRVMSMIRNPYDAITSQYELWGGNIVEREKAWVNQYNQLKTLRSYCDEIPLYRYEEFSHDPIAYGAYMFLYAGLSTFNDSFSHIKPVNEGRYKKSQNEDVINWKPSKEFMEHLELYNYA